MRVLFATCRGDDYMSACVWDGLQDALGEANVYDAELTPNLHSPTASGPVGRVGTLTATGTSGNCTHIAGAREGRVLAEEGDFDLLVLNACFLREHDWHWPWGLRRRLRTGGKVAYVEGWDSAHEVHDPMRESGPPFHVDAVFRRELDPAFNYPYACHSLTMAAPARWFHPEGERPIDVFYAANWNSHPARWDVLSQMWRTKTRHWSIGASRGVGFDAYFDFLRQAKLALCPAGAARGDSLRTYEIIACGAIPVFVDYPPWKREPWFGDSEAFFCETAETLPRLLDMALSWDLGPMRQHLREYALVNHTTKARAERMLRLTGF